MSCTCLPCKITALLEEHFAGGPIGDEQHAEMMDALARVAGPNLAFYPTSDLHAFVGRVVAYRRIKQTEGAPAGGTPDTVLQ
ncbi:hypothetical protein [Methylobacterium aquaticum]|uniref:Uncharacterized protein n=1 Tax=Methylobacterium aquaticum TaxID=270351 RepID=A0A0C6FH05_9HYPH|nr:hypothetical protein [Methylobacterium aquaticum]BAQ44354.1 hypothetical protein Maq22A_c04720 [Methylobacterium aquaticum]